MLPGLYSPLGDELALRRDDGDLVAGFGIPLDAIDRGVEHPGVAGEERTGTTRLDEHTAGDFGFRIFDFGLAPD